MGQSSGSAIVTASADGVITGTHNVTFNHVAVFKTKDMLPSQVSGSASGGRSIAIDSSGNIYAAGADFGSGLWIVRKSADGGATWSTVDSYRPTGNSQAKANAVSIDSTGAIYVGGSAGDLGGLTGVIRKSSDHGSTWNTVDTFVDTPLLSGDGNGVKSIVIDSSDKVYASGSNGSWIVRMSSNGGTTWTTVDSYQFSAGHHASANAITIDALGNIYAVGFGTDLSNVWQWIVRKSSNAGISWSTVDSYVLGTGYFAIPTSITTDGNGNLYTAGFEGAFSVGTFYPPSSWVVRKGSESGSTWITIVSSPTRESGTMANGIATDSGGNIYVVGLSGNNWTVKKGTHSGSVWTNLDSFHGPWGPTSVAAAFGNVYATGMAQQWITRILYP
ncbi:MAG: hypothetical protein ABIQ95_15675 [Bdellovibrionia bacterium]